MLSRFARAADEYAIAIIVQVDAGMAAFRIDPSRALEAHTLFCQAQLNVLGGVVIAENTYVCGIFRSIALAVDGDIYRIAAWVIQALIEIAIDDVIAYSD